MLATHGQLMSLAGLGPASGEMRVAVSVPAQSEAMSGFPIYVDLATMPPEFWSNRPWRDGRDIRVKSSAGVAIPAHLVSIDVGNETGSLFVRASLSSTGETSFYIHWGDDALGPVADADAAGAYAVWADYHRVFLFNMLAQDFTGSDQAAAPVNRIRYLQKTAEKTGLAEHQGVCWDGTHYYLTDTNAINKYDAAWNLVASNPNPVGDVGNGTNHCGDPDIHGGVLYVPVENYVNTTTFSSQRIARFNASDLTFINSVDVSAQGDEVAAIAINPATGVLSTCEYKSAFAFDVQNYDLTTLAHIGTTTVSAPNGSLIQGVQYWRGGLFANSDHIDYTIRGNDAENGTIRVWTDIADGATTRAGNYEGLGSTDSALLVLRDDGASSVLHTISPIVVEAGGGFEAVNSVEGASGVVGSGLTNHGTFTMGVSVVANTIGAVNQAVLSYTANQTANTNRVTIAHRVLNGKWGLWDTGNTWLESTSNASTAKTRLHARYNGTVSRSLFVNGVKEGNATSLVAAPTGKVTLRVGTEDTSLAEPCYGKFGFAYLRASALSDAWIAAECANLSAPGSFYTVGTPEPV